MRNCLLLAAVPFLTPALTAQDTIPVKNWAAPLYWQPTLSETDAARKASDIKEARGPEAQTPPNSLVFVAMTPCRVVDTRRRPALPPPFGPPSLSGGSSRTFPIQSSTTCTIPGIAQAYSLNAE
jgi:hypothetical protein